MPVVSREHQEQIYCAEQINIPVTLPSILKDYAKAAIRTQPYDLLGWTAAYFRALANDELPPVKERLEYPPYVHTSGITPRFLKILLNQYGQDRDWGQVAEPPRTMTVKLESLLRRWRGMALKDTSLYQILMTGRLLDLPGDPGICDLYRFLATACGLLGNHLYDTMIYICELLTEEPDGGSAMIPFNVFMNLYEYLAALDCSGGQSIIAPGQSSSETVFGQDEVSPGRSSRSSFSSPIVSTSSGASSKETRAARCRSIDNSTEATDTEESFCSSEGQFDGEDEFASLDDELSVRARADRILEGASTRSPCGCSVSAGQKAIKRPRATNRSELESTSQNTYESEQRLESRVPESIVERVDGVETEVTRVQEERRRRRDVEFHSRGEKVRLPVDDETKTVVELQPSLVSSASSPRRGTLSSLSAESHVDVFKDLTANESGPRTKPMSQELELTAETSATRSSQLAREAGGADVSRAEDSSLANDSIENIPRDDEQLNTVPNGNTGRTNVKRIPMKKRAKAADTRSGDVDKDIEKNGQDSLEENDLATSKKSYSEGGNDGQISSNGDSASKGETVVGGIGADPGDYDGGEFYDEDEGVEEFEDTAKYETIDLENVLKGICECLEPRKDAGDLKRESSQSRETVEASQQPDLVREFFDKMRVTECPTGSYILPEVPGIGPVVSPETVTAVGLWLTECSRRQQGQVGPRNLRHFMCPNLDGTTCSECHPTTKAASSTEAE